MEKKLIMQDYQFKLIKDELKCLHQFHFERHHRSRLKNKNQFTNRHSVPSVVKVWKIKSGNLEEEI